MSRASNDATEELRWRSPQVLLPLLAVLATAAWALRAAPPPVAPVPVLTVDAAEAEQPPVRETMLYVVDESGLARPVARELAAPSAAGERLQTIVDALRSELVESGAWPSDLPAPLVHAFELERASVAVLDLPAGEVPVSVAAERSILASLTRTLFEAGVDRIAYLREGRAVPAWLGTVATPSALD